VEFDWRAVSYEKEHSSAKFSLEGNGAATKESNYEQRYIYITIRCHCNFFCSTPGSSKEKIQSIQKKIKNRIQFNELENTLLKILNMTDAAKFQEIIEKYDDKQQHPLFNRSAEKISFKINVNGQKLRYIHNKDKANSDEGDETTESFDDVESEQIDSWDLKDEKTVRKQGLITILIGDF
jgi:hypothetical protein